MKILNAFILSFLMMFSSFTQAVEDTTLTPQPKVYVQAKGYAVTENEVQVHVNLNIEDGWHIYGHESVGTGLPTSIRWSQDGLKIKPIQSVWPSPINFSFSGIESKGYKGEVPVVFSFSTDDVSSTKALTGEISYLACHDICIPESQIFNVKIETDPSLTSETGALTAQPSSHPSAGYSMITLLLFAFVGGLILNAMPCVFPVLSIKLFSILKRGDNRRAIAEDSLWFVLGVVSVFWVFAGLMLSLRTVSESVGWGFHLQSPYTIFVLILVFFLMSLNFFGIFEIGLMFTRVSALSPGQKSSNTSSKTTSFFNGALTTLVATPCTAPFMGTALGATLTTGPMATLLIFTALGVGLSFPFILLPIFPGLVRKLPKPGAWMEVLKQFFGFPLLLTSVWLTTVLVTQTYALVWLHVTLMLVGISMAAWILGKWQKSRKLAALILAIAMFIASIGHGVYFLKEKTSDIHWQPYSAELLKELDEKRKPYFVDVTADWCVTCKVNERLFYDADIQALINKQNIIMIKADWTNKDSAITKYLASYGRNGVPLYVYQPFTGKGEAKILPQILTKRIILDTLELQ